VGGEDTSRANLDFLLEVVSAVKNAGARRFRIADTLSVLEPFATHALVAALRAESDLELEFHGHDDLGLATANTLAAIRAGASHASVTVIGLGERAGNAPLEEVAVAMLQLFGHDTGILTTELGRVARLVAVAAACPVPANKAIVGDNVFTHESGIHVDGLLKDRSTYQFLDPAMLGLSHRFVIGKHSGLAAVAACLSDLRLEAKPAECIELLARVRQHAVRTKRSVTDEELATFLEDIRRPARLEVATRAAANR
ncbi:MAG: homocitrate synthase, partial [Hyphomicrobium sp.]